MQPCYVHVCMYTDVHGCTQHKKQLIKLCYFIIYVHFFVLVSQSAAHHQLVDAYQKTITRYYQQLVTVLPIEDLMEDLMKGKIISHRQQVMIDSKHARAGKICIHM